MSEDTIRVIVGDRQFDFPKSKVQELNNWLMDKGKLIIEPKDDLVIDIETTSGASIKDIADKEDKKINEARHKKSKKR